MASGDRTQHFPAIERRYGQPISHWLDMLAALETDRYADQMDVLQGQHGFSRAHANTLVMYARGSTTTRRFDGVDAYLAQFDDERQATARAILDTITARHPCLTVVMAWNQPMVMLGDQYVFGLSVQSRHVLLAPWGADAIAAVRHLLNGYAVNKKTVRVPVGWDVDTDLLEAMVTHRLDELAAPDH